MQEVPEPATSLTAKAWQYGVLGVVALAFAWAIVVLFKALRADAQKSAEREVAIERERGEWAKREAVARAEMTAKEDELRAEFARREADTRAEYERKHREIIDSYNTLTRTEHRENRAHEDKVREEFSEIMEKVSADAGKQADALVSMLQKFYERFVGPTRPRY